MRCEVMRRDAINTEREQTGAGLSENEADGRQESSGRDDPEEDGRRRGVEVEAAVAVVGCSQQGRRDCRGCPDWAVGSNLLPARYGAIRGQRGPMIGCWGLGRGSQRRLFPGDLLVPLSLSLSSAQSSQSPLSPLSPLALRLPPIVQSCAPRPDLRLTSLPSPCPTPHRPTNHQVSTLYNCRVRHHVEFIE